MDGEPLPGDGRGRHLDSWKEIAAYLRRDVRTVQRWEIRERMPVHRQPHQKQGSVYAFSGELDAWRQAPGATAQGAPAIDRPVADLRPPARGRRLAAVAAVGLLLALAIVVPRHRPTAAAPSPAPVALPAGTRFFARAAAEGARPRIAPLAGVPRTLQYSPDGSTVYAIYDRGLDVIAVSTGTVRRHIGIGAQLGPVAVATDGRLFLADLLRPEVYVLQGATGAATSLPLPGSANSLALTRDGGQLYATIGYAGVEGLDTRGSAKTWFPLPPCPSQLALAPGSEQIFVGFQCGGPCGRPGHDAIGVFDPAHGDLRTAFSGPPLVGGNLAVSPDGRELWAYSGDACTNPRYDHVGCPSVPSAVLYLMDARQHATWRARSFSDASGRIAVLPGGRDAIAVGRDVVLHLAASLIELEAAPVAPVFAVSPDGRHLVAQRTSSPPASSHSVPGSGAATAPDAAPVPLRSTRRSVGPPGLSTKKSGLFTRSKTRS